jgi:hypothetical protein
MSSQIDSFLKTRKGKLNSFEDFKNTKLYKHYVGLFGEIIYTEDKSKQFIACDNEGFFYDEMYYPYKEQETKGIIIPKSLYELDVDGSVASIEWEEVASKGAKSLDIKMDPNLRTQAVTETFLPYGYNDKLSKVRTIQHPYFETLIDSYEDPDNIRCPEYLIEIVDCCLRQIPKAQPLMEMYRLKTADIIKYIHNAEDWDDKKGPYSYHIDYFPGLLWMFFTYFPLHSPVEGREVSIGRRSNIEMSADNKGRLGDEPIETIMTIPIKNDQVILMNTLNPIYAHKVEKLKHDNEVVMMTNYLWGPRSGR